MIPECSFGRPKWKSGGLPGCKTNWSIRSRFIHWIPSRLTWLIFKSSSRV